jgi:hypothetical protein
VNRGGRERNRVKGRGDAPLTKYGAQRWSLGDLAEFVLG